WLRDQLFIKRFHVRVFKWFMNFSANYESPILPMWIGFLLFPVQFFSHSCILISIVEDIGNPLKVDSATTNLMRPSMARVCFEANLTKQLPKRVWIRTGDNICFPIVELGLD
ncbi:hypothetical protein CFOL_v3_05315, partial [Cephalotus follicularis]